MIRFVPFAFLLSLTLTAPLTCQTDAGALPAGTPLVVAADRNYPMRALKTIRGTLMYAVYADNKLVLPRGAVVAGEVVALHPDRARRVRARLGGDFTRFHTPEVRFVRIVLSDGSTLPITTTAAADGAPIYRAVAPPSAKGGLLRREFDAGINAARRDIAVFTTPGKGDRLLQFIYARLPYHPERIAAGTAWTVETAAPVQVPAEPALTTDPLKTERKRHFWDEPTPKNDTLPESGAWIVQANLGAPLNSESSHTGEAVQAVVAEPIYAPDGSLAVPQGSKLTGAVTRARPARWFGRTGVLSFNFTQLRLPNAETRTVETRLTEADAAAEIALNSEGQVQSKPQDKVTIPLILALMASRPLDMDEGRHGGAGTGASTGKNATGGAAGLSLVGTVVAIAGGSPYAAAGIGYWGAAREFYSRWIARGQRISFPKDTRIVVETTLRRSAPLKPQ